MSAPTTITDSLDEATLLRLTGWHLEHRGACRGDVCVPLGADATGPEQLGAALGVAVVHDEERGLWAVGPEARAHTLRDAALPDVTLAGRDGSPFALRSLVGRRGVLLAWASW